MNAVDVFNAIEVVMWVAIAATLWLRSHRMKLPGHARWASLLFMLFAVSDMVELKTGAWWRPWWLFVGKVICVGGLLTVAIAAKRALRTIPSQQSSSEDHDQHEAQRGD